MLTFIGALRPCRKQFRTDGSSFTHWWPSTDPPRHPRRDPATVGNNPICAALSVTSSFPTWCPPFIWRLICVQRNSEVMLTTRCCAAAVTTTSKAFASSNVCRCRGQWQSFRVKLDWHDADLVTPAEVLAAQLARVTAWNGTRLIQASLCPQGGVWLLQRSLLRHGLDLTSQRRRPRVNPNGLDPISRWPPPSFRSARGVHHRCDGRRNRGTLQPR